jgi:hypothetical protein
MVPRIRKLPRDRGEWTWKLRPHCAIYPLHGGLVETQRQSRQNNEKKNNCSYGGSNSCCSVLILSLYKVIPVQCRLHILRDKCALFWLNVQHRGILVFEMKYLQITTDLFVKNNLCGNVLMKLKVPFDQNLERGYIIIKSTWKVLG